MLRWLTEAGPGVPSEVRDLLRHELFASPRAIAVSVCHELLLCATATLLLPPGSAFPRFMGIVVALGAARLLALRHVSLAMRRGLPTSTDLYLACVILWAALQGAMAFTAMRTDNQALQVLVATTTITLQGAIYARCYPAPRFALLLIVLCFVPFGAGAALSGERWLLLLLVQMPLYLLSSTMLVRRFHNMAVAALMARQESQDRARHDPLTGLLNRFGLAERVSKYDERARRRFVLFYLDLDGFKQINDRFGHQVGDSLLQAVAARLRSSLRQEDAVARMGGDEFLVVARDMTAEEARRCADNIIERIASQPYALGAPEPLRIGVSIGFACSPEDGVALEDLHRRADAALYDAKFAGKGRCCRFDGLRDRGIPCGSSMAERNY
jgi:diguanylate cyclase (GGDEF)-like protein